MTCIRNHSENFEFVEISLWDWVFDCINYGSSHNLDMNDPFFSHFPNNL